SRVLPTLARVTQDTTASAKRLAHLIARSHSKMLLRQAGAAIGRHAAAFPCVALAPAILRAPLPHLLVALPVREQSGYAGWGEEVAPPTALAPKWVTTGLGFP